MLRVLSAGALALMVSIGHRCGLFDVMSGLSPSSAREISEQSGLDERYVREWLAAMASGGLLELDAQSGTYRLPAEHAAVLARTARGWNPAVAAQWIPMLGSMEERILACFERGGGVPATAFPRLQALVGEQSQNRLQGLASFVLPRLPALVQGLERGIEVLDVGCGSGRILQWMARTFPASRFHGIDVSPEAVASARSVVREEGLQNLHFELCDAADLREREVFDLVTAFGSLPAQAHPDVVLGRIARALRRDGTFLVQALPGTGRLDQDVQNPLAPFFYTLSCLHAIVVSGGAGWGAMWGRERILAALSAAGLAEIESFSVPNDPVGFYWVARRSA